MKNPPERIISDIYIWAMLFDNGIKHKSMLPGADGRKAFSFEDSSLFNAIVKAFSENIKFTAIVDGIKLQISPKGWARAIQDVKSLIHS